MTKASISNLPDELSSKTAWQPVTWMIARFQTSIRTSTTTRKKSSPNCKNATTHEWSYTLAMLRLRSTTSTWTLIRWNENSKTMKSGILNHASFRSIWVVRRKNKSFLLWASWLRNLRKANMISNEALFNNYLTSTLKNVWLRVCFLHWWSFTLAKLNLRWLQNGVHQSLHQDLPARAELQLLSKKILLLRLCA